jgi:polyhydroxybutyrate depolymerase
MFTTESACSSGCGKALPHGFSPGKTTTVEIPATKNQPVRHYNVHLPTDYQTNRGHAIVFSFHGRSRDMYTQEDISELSQEGLLVNGIGIIAVYPQGIAGKDGKTAWQGAPYSAPGVDDVSPLQFFSTSFNTELIM